MSLATTWRQAFWDRMRTRVPDVVGDPDRAYQRTVQLVQVTYALWAYEGVQALRRAGSWVEDPAATLLWPARWMAAVPWGTAVSTAVALLLLGSLAAALVPRSAVARVVALVGILSVEGLRYSYDKIGHSHHLWVLAALVLVMLPRHAPRDDDDRRAWLEGAWGVQAVILATYTLAGLQKLWGAGQDLLEDGTTVFHLDSLALHIAKVRLRGIDAGPLGPFFLDHPALGGVLMIGALGLELVAITLVFRPRLQRLFGIGAIAMHVGIGLVMDIWFDAQVFVVAVWLLGTPFVVGPPSARATLAEVPVVGPPLARRLAPRT